MFCPKCGFESPEGSSFCNSCGESFAMPEQGVAPNPPAYQGRPIQEGQAERVPNYMVWSIICIFLCWPLAIPAIVFAAKVDTLLSVGDVAGARAASGKAKGWATAATVVAVIGFFLGLVVSLVS